MGIGSDKSGAGVHTIIFALETILYNSEGKQKVITPQYFGKTVKGHNIHDYRNPLTRIELKRYKNQLLNAYDFWDNPDWKVTKREDRTTRLIFTKKEEKDKGKR